METPKPAPIDTKALREKWARPASEGRRANLNERREVEAMLDEIESLRRERDALATARDAAQAEVEKGNAGARLLTAQWEAALANARAFALEEAARLLEQRVILFSEIDVLMTPLEERAHFAKSIRALAQTPPSGRYVESVVLHSILGHIEASMQHTHGVDCRGFDDGDDLNSDGDCGCGLVSASKARAALAALEGVKP